jgi:hypothetical protein
VTPPWSQYAALRLLWYIIFRANDFAPECVDRCLCVATTGKGVETRESFRTFLVGLYGPGNEALVDLTIERVDTIWRTEPPPTYVEPAELCLKRRFGVTPSAYDHLRGRTS